MGDANPIRTLVDYSKPSHKGYRNSIELPKRNNVVPLRSDTIRTHNEFLKRNRFLDSGEQTGGPLIALEDICALLGPPSVFGGPPPQGVSL
nr:zinc finger, CCHC-type [Tanacetum cinerariifolium]